MEVTFPRQPNLKLTDWWWNKETLINCLESVGFRDISFSVPVFDPKSPKWV